MNPSEASPIFAEFAVDNPDYPPMHFQTFYKGTMLMYAVSNAVADYLNAHGNWFHRCAQPMKVEPFTEQGYILTVGKFGSFGYEVEPKIAVVFDPPQAANYKMYNVPLPDVMPQGYAIDYKADMYLGDIPWVEVSRCLPKAAHHFGDRPLPDIITQVHWQLHLQVMVQFPKFIYKLPQQLLRTTGDRLLSSIVAQISPRLTTKIQQDFHNSLNLPTPPKSANSLELISLNPDQGEEIAAVTLEQHAKQDAKEKEDIGETVPENVPHQGFVI